MTATLASIQRHPLKSHGREQLASVSLTAGRGLPWDRRWAVAHDAAKLTEGAWGPCANFMIGSRTPKLMAISAELDEGAARLTLRHPDCPDLTFQPDQPGDLAGFLDWVRPFCAPERAQPERIYSVPDRGMTDTDYPSVSLINLASNRALAEHLGSNLSPLRWRANFWIEGLAPYAERAMVGKKLRLGAAVLEVTEPKVRCLATTANPDTGERDADTLGALRGMFGNQEFGIYARVIESGAVRRGDRLEVIQ